MLLPLEAAVAPTWPEWTLLVDTELFDFFIQLSKTSYFALPEAIHMALAAPFTHERPQTTDKAGFVVVDFPKHTTFGGMHSRT